MKSESLELLILVGKREFRITIRIRTIVDHASGRFRSSDKRFEQIACWHGVHDLIGLEFVT